MVKERKKGNSVDGDWDWRWEPSYSVSEKLLCERLTAPVDLEMAAGNAFGVSAPYARL